MNIKIKTYGGFYFRNNFGVLCVVKSEFECPSYDLSCKANREEAESIIRNLLAKKQEVTLVPVSQMRCKEG